MARDGPRAVRILESADNIGRPTQRIAVSIQAGIQIDTTDWVVRREEKTHAVIAPRLLPKHVTNLLECAPCRWIIAGRLPAVGPVGDLGRASLPVRLNPPKAPLVSSR